MGDRAWTTVPAWPYPGHERLPQAVIDELAAHNQLPDHDTPHDDDWYGAGVIVLAGDERSGPILEMVDEEANYGTEAYRELITALSAAGLHVYAGNDAGGGYGASWEYQPPFAAGSRGEGRRCDGGELVVGASDLLGAGERTLEEVPDTVLAARARRLLAHPDGIPAAVVDLAHT